MKKHSVGHLNRIADLFGLLRNMTFFRKSGEAFKLLFFEQADAVKVIFNHLFLLVGFADFIVVRGDASDVVQYLAAFVCCHLCEAGHVALEHDVVAVRTCVCCAKKSVEHLLRAVFSVQFVGCNRVV